MNKTRGNVKTTFDTESSVLLGFCMFLIKSRNCAIIIKNHFKNRVPPDHM